ncbi:hypothetical protein QTP88_020958 [Uroleucon formosanum]
MPSQKSKTVVSPLIISKARIQSVPNRSPNQALNSDPSDGWITPTSEKRTITSPSTPTSRPQATKKVFVTQNRFSLFSDTIDASENNPEPEKMEQEPEHLENSPAPTKPPPPIFIRVVNDYKAFCDNIKQLTNGEPFVCKSSIKGIKLSTSSPDSYRSVIKFLQSNKAAFHTYQLKQDRSFRIVIRNLHHSTPIKEIEKELLALGHMSLVPTQPITEDALCSKKIQSVHHLKRSNPTQANLKEVPSNVKSTNVNTTSNMNTQPKKSYAQATTSDLPSQDIPTNASQNHDQLAHQMALFLQNFQSTINPLISLLTTLIEKLILSNDK